MELCRSLGLLTGSLALVTILIALSTDFWFVAMGPTFSSHSGLWPEKSNSEVPGKGQCVSYCGWWAARGQALKSYLGAGYIRVTQSLSILAALSGLVSVIFLILSYVPSLSIRGYGPLSSSIMAFAAGRLWAALGFWGPVSFRRGSEPSLIFIPSHFCCGGHGGLYQ